MSFSSSRVLRAVVCACVIGGAVELGGTSRAPASSANTRRRLDNPRTAADRLHREPRPVADCGQVFGAKRRDCRRVRAARDQAPARAVVGAGRTRLRKRVERRRAGRRGEARQRLQLLHRQRRLAVARRRARVRERSLSRHLRRRRRARPRRRRALRIRPAGCAGHRSEPGRDARGRGVADRAEPGRRAGPPDARWPAHPDAAINLRNAARRWIAANRQPVPHHRRASLRLRGARARHDAAAGRRPRPRLVHVHRRHRRRNAQRRPDGARRHRRHLHLRLRLVGRFLCDPRRRRLPRGSDRMSRASPRTGHNSCT